MNNYYPEAWVLLKISSIDKPDEKPLYKVFATWRGSYAEPDYWKINSGCTKIVDVDDHYEFHGYSGSIYICKPSRYGILFGADIIKQFEQESKKCGYDLTVLDSNTDFFSLGISE
jgi:hypothetical protein